MQELWNPETLCNCEPFQLPVRKPQFKPEKVQKGIKGSPFSGPPKNPTRGSSVKLVKSNPVSRSPSEFPQFLHPCMMSERGLRANHCFLSSLKAGTRPLISSLVEIGQCVNTFTTWMLVELPFSLSEILCRSWREKKTDKTWFSSVIFLPMNNVCQEME